MRVLLHFLLTVAACAGLWRLWRSIAATDARVAMIVSLGFLVRVLGGQALFWISWLHLPVARSLQTGDGLWFFALDGRTYLDAASQILRRGPLALFRVDAVYASHTFVQLLTACTAAFGPFASVAILLNAFAFLATCLLIVRLADPRGPARLACLVTLSAVAFSPSAILWSLQPLKDTVFVMLVVAMACAGRLWQRACQEENWAVARRRLATAAAAMLGVIYAVAGMRWYVGVIMWVGAGVFLGLTAITARRRGPVAIAAVAVFVLLSQSLRFGGADDIAPWLQRQLDPRTALASLGSIPIATHLAETRRGFETTPGGTMITAGKPAPRPQPPAVTQPAVAIAAAPSTSTPHPTTQAASSATTTAAPPTASVPATASAAAPARVRPTRAAAVPAPPSHAAPPPTHPAPLPSRPAPPPPAATASHAAPPISHPAAPTPSAPLVSRHAPPAPLVESRWHRALGQLGTGLAAIALPISVGRLLGIISIGGGRNLWAFVDLDTVAFDLVLLFAVWYGCRHVLSRRWPTPLFVMVAVILLATVVPMAYAVTNFGTLFRLREMVYMLTALLPVTLAPALTVTRSIRQEPSRSSAPARVE